MSRVRLTIRGRLALLYSTIFLVGGAVLLGVAYALVAASLHAGRGGTVSATAAGVPTIGTPTQITGTATTLPGSEGTVQFQSAVSTAVARTNDHALHNLLIYGLLVLLAVALASWAGGWLVAGRALRPVATITAAARRLSAEELAGHRIALDGPADELKELADTFDAMLDRLARQFDGQRHFAATAAHELRTPLAIQRTVLEVGLQDPGTPPDWRRRADQLLAATTRTERLLESLLLLAQTSLAPADRTELDLAEVAAEALDAQSDEVMVRQLHVDADLIAAHVLAHPELLRRAVGNLVDNAVRHNVDGGGLRVRTQCEEGWSHLVVDNDGPVIPADELHALFDPFVRRQATRLHGTQGSGLGLAIVRSVVEAHGGRIQAEARPEGGLRITMALPGQAGVRSAGAAGLAR